MLADDARATVFAEDGTAFSSTAWSGGRDAVFGGLNLSQGVGGGVSVFADYRLQPRLEGAFSERAIVGLIVGLLGGLRRAFKSETLRRSQIRGEADFSLQLLRETCTSPARPWRRCRYRLATSTLIGHVVRKSP